MTSAPGLPATILIVDDVSANRKVLPVVSLDLLFIADGETPRFAGGLGGIKGLPVLTVSDGKGFVEAGGIIELYLEGGRMRFAINVDTAERAGLRLSSRLLRLARVVREGHAQ